MSITFDHKSRSFKLDTKNTTYIIGLADEPGYAGHVYYGKKLPDADLNYLMRTGEPPFVPSQNERERCSFNDFFPFEYPAYGAGDYRDCAFGIRTEEGYRTATLCYKNHAVFAGKKKLEGLPAVFAGEDEAQTLELELTEPDLGFSVILSYTVIPECDVITRSVRVVNTTSKTFYLERVMSSVLNLENDPELDVITLHGSWARERHVCRRPIPFGKSATSSYRGESGHQDHPFIAVCDHTAGEDTGRAYGLSLIYSGNFIAQAEKTQFDQVRVITGINPEGFCWKLEPGQSFTSPEAAMTFSAEGLGRMSRNFHDLYRAHLIRGKYKDRPRPILINNWEATYFNFDTDKLIEIAKCAAGCGIEMLVMDDGWFGHRSSDDSSLGDWVVNEKKLPGGLKRLSDEVTALGLKLGIWFEPEMISPDSDLYRAHPDWAVQVPYKTPAMSRCQYVLDVTRKEVRDYVYASVSAILKSADISYVKWDMNRQLSDVGSAKLSPDTQGEFFHRYCLGLYELQERLITDFPDLLLENCSGGGARFDAGMLYYSPQIWCSDDTDAIERLVIQEGTSYVYPLSCMGAHVSVCPNHSVGRVTPFETRGNVALLGTFGYELDITKLSEDELSQIRKQVDDYHRFNGLIRTGDHYRCLSYRENGRYNLEGVVSRDKKEALFVFVRVLGVPNAHSKKIFFKGLDPDAYYRIEGSEKIYSGAALMNAGYLVTGLWGDFVSRLIHITAV